MSCCSSPVQKRLLLLISFSALIRILMAAWLEFGNDEVYYWTYALYPDWSHFDHPPMVGWMMQLFSLNLTFDSELFLRLSSVVLMSANSVTIFFIGKRIKNEPAGFYAALLYNASIYAFVITGIFILPDTPQNFFWLLAVLAFLQAFGEGRRSEKQQAHWMLAAGLFAGLSMLSKYTGVFLWFGAGLYVIFYQRSWFKRPSLYFSILISAVCMLPVLLWNIGNDFISFSFQGERVSFWNASLRPDYFLTELAGQIMYNNPVNVVLIWVAVFGILKRPNMMNAGHWRFLLLATLPLIGIFLFFSLFRATLPHWTGPAYNTLLLVAGVWLADRKPQNDVIKIPSIGWFSLGLLVLVLLLGSLQIKFGLIPINDPQAYHELGKNDVTLDMYGWSATEPAFEQTRKRLVESGLMHHEDAIVSDNWFPLANIDYYIARPLDMKVLGLGSPDRLHKYMWINDKRGGLTLGADYWYLTTSRDYRNPQDVYGNQFDTIIPADTITITRNGEPAKRVFVFLLKGLNKMPESPGWSN